MSTGRRRRYTDAYKEHACKMVVFSSRPIRHVAKDLEIGEQMLGRWVKDWRVANDQPTPVEDSSKLPALADAPPMEKPEPGPSILEEFEAAVEATPWIGESDRAIVALLKNYGRQMDSANQLDNGVSAAYLGPHANAALRDLGMTPIQRITLKLGRGERAKSRLAVLRDSRSGADRDDDEGETA